MDSSCELDDDIRPLIDAFDGINDWIYSPNLSHSSRALSEQTAGQIAPSIHNSIEQSGIEHLSPMVASLRRGLLDLSLCLTLETADLVSKTKRSEKCQTIEEHTQYFREQLLAFFLCFGPIVQNLIPTNGRNLTPKFQMSNMKANRLRISHKDLRDSIGGLFSHDYTSYMQSLIKHRNYSEAQKARFKSDLVDEPTKHVLSTIDELAKAISCSELELLRSEARSKVVMIDSALEKARRLIELKNCTDNNWQDFRHPLVQILHDPITQHSIHHRNLPLSPSEEKTCQLAIPLIKLCRVIINKSSTASDRVINLSKMGVIQFNSLSFSYYSLSDHINELVMNLGFQPYDRQELIDCVLNIEATCQVIYETCELFKFRSNSNWLKLWFNQVLPLVQTFISTLRFN